MKRILTFKQAELIRELRLKNPTKYTYQALADLFKIKKITVKEILKYKSYITEEYLGHTKLSDEDKKAIIFIVNQYPKYSLGRGQIIKEIAKLKKMSPTIIRRIAHG